MDNIKGVSFTPPAITGEAKPPETPKDAAPQQKDQVSIGEDQPKPPDALKPHKKWLFLNYIAADCNLVEFQMKNIDNQELVGSDNNTHIVAYIDVGPKPNPLDQSWQGCRTYYVTKDDVPDKLNSELIQEHGDHVDMSNPETLKNFIVDAVGKFPSDYVCLVLNDHGGGFTGAMTDDSDGNFMSMPQIKQALTDAQAITGKKIDIVGFDACLMAEAEVAYELKDNANIMLASEESEGGPGWTYNSMLGGQTMGEAIKTAQESMIHKIDVGPEEFAKIVVNINQQHQGDISTFSALNLGKMDEFKDNMQGLAQAVRKTEDKAAVKNAIAQAEAYGGGWLPYRDIHDVQHMAELIAGATSDEALKAACQKVIDGMGGLVIANENSPETHPNSHGISVYTPTDSSTVGYNYGDLGFAKETEWDEMCSELGVGGPPSDQGDPRRWPTGEPRKPKHS